MICYYFAKKASTGPLITFWLPCTSMKGTSGLRECSLSGGKALSRRFNRQRTSCNKFGSIARTWMRSEEEGSAPVH